MRFVDANVFLFARLDAGARGEAARKALRQIDAANRAATSAFVLNEVFWSLRKHLGRAEALALSGKLSRMPGLVLLPVDEGAWRRALALMKAHGHLKPNDALHAATALEAGIGTILSTDDDFDGLAGLRRQALG